MFHPAPRIRNSVRLFGIHRRESRQFGQTGDASDSESAICYEYGQNGHTSVLGRKNHLGSRSARGAKVTAIYYSLLETAYLNGLDPYKYLVSASYTMIQDPDTVSLPIPS